jgi:hypothetical protein
MLAFGSRGCKFIWGTGAKSCVYLEAHLHLHTQVICGETAADSWLKISKSCSVITEKKYLF